MKHAELNQLDRRIEELQQRLKKKTTLLSTNSMVVESLTSSHGFRTALDTVQDTLNHINIAEIEKHMVQLAHSFNSIHTNGSSITNQISPMNSATKVCELCFIR